ncbi:hypothetical protein D3C73_1009520 [compost metagenome]
MRPGQRQQGAGRQGGRDECTGGGVAVQQSHCRMTARVSVEQAFGQVGQELIQPQQFIAFAHALAAAVDQHQDRLLRALRRARGDRLQHYAR